MRLQHWLKRENSGLAKTTLELAKYEELQGHQVCLRQPDTEGLIYGKVTEPDVHVIHSQLPVDTYFDRKPKFMWMHGEPLSSLANGVSMKALVDLAPKVDAFIAMRREEMAVWSSIKRNTHLVPKGIDLDVYKPVSGLTERLSGEPAVLYYENWRGERNPLYLCVAMEQVWRKFPNARLHLYNCPSQQMQDCFSALNQNNKWWPFLRSILGPVEGGSEDVNILLNKCDIVVSGLYPLYARSIEAFGAGKAFISAAYKEPGYPWTVSEYSPEALADTIIKCWEGYDSFNYRQWAQDHHDVAETVRQSIAIYEKYL